MIGLERCVWRLSGCPDELSHGLFAAGPSLVVVEAENVAEHDHRFSAYEAWLALS